MPARSPPAIELTPKAGAIPGRPADSADRSTEDAVADCGKVCVSHVEMRINSERESVRLLDFRADAAVGINAMNGDAGLRQIVRIQEVPRVGSQT